jgi:hypothetical protein
MAQPKSRTPGPAMRGGGPSGRGGSANAWKGGGRRAATEAGPPANLVGTARASQAVSTYGPGAPMDLLSEAVLVGGLDFWRYRNDDEGWIVEPRLRDVIAARFGEHQVALSRARAFRRPPISTEQQHSPSQGLPVLQFPIWFVCQSCRELVHGSDLQEQKRAPYKHSCKKSEAKKSQPNCVPVRFLLTCRDGHIEEFCWARFAHHGQESDCSYPVLRLDEGASGDVSEITVQCLSCEAPPQPLVRAYRPEANGICAGKRPWLGRDSDEPCTQPLRLLARSASNGYFAQVVSGLAIPDLDRAAHHAVSANWPDLDPVKTIEHLGFVRQQRIGPRLRAFSDQQLMDAIAAIRNGSDPKPESVRSAEWYALVSCPEESPGDTPAAGEQFHARRLKPVRPLPSFLDQVVLVSSLREVRVQVGFTRLEAPTPDLQGEFDLGVTSARLGLHTDWLPASEVKGEGIFLTFDQAAVARWEERSAVQKRAAELRKGFQAWQAKQAESLGVRIDELPGPEFPGVRFYMLHALSHLLMNALSLECGYGASALSERIYCSPPDGAGPPMAGILISTGTHGAEGTLGGLVDQGRQIERHMMRAIDLGALCSHDPVCAAHSPADDIAERHLEGAACHGCLFVAECSCERFNQYLDRALVVPTVGHEDVAFLPSAL